MRKHLKKILFAIILLVCLPNFFYAQLEQVQIISVSRIPEQNNRDRESSLEGGTLFYVKGYGFDTQMANNNYVYVGNVRVDVEGNNNLLKTYNGKMSESPKSKFNIFYILLVNMYTR